MKKNNNIFYVTIIIILYFPFFSKGSWNSDREVLIEFYKRTTEKTHWTNSQGWLEAFSDHCQWTGISCNQQKSVETIILVDNNIVGSLPSSLGLLESLKTLNLEKNALSGEIPNSFSNLKELRVLNLKNNMITSVGGSAFTGLEKLETISLGMNRIKELSSFEGSTNIQSLDVSLNELEEVSKGLINLENLITLTLSSNSKLKSLNVSNLQRLNKLELSNTNIQTISQVVGLENLKSSLFYLDLSSNSLNSFPSELSNLSKLQVLKLSQNSISNITENLDEMTSLRDFYCSKCNLSKFPLLKKVLLNNLDLSDNYNLEELDLSLQTTLTSIDVSTSKLVPSSLENFKSLLSFTLSGSAEPPELPDSIVMIIMWNSSFSKWPQSWSKLKNLIQFNVFFQRTKIDFPSFLFDDQLSSFSKLKDFTIKGSIFGTISSKISETLPFLQTLSISGTNISGSLPTQIGNLNELSLLSIRDNLFMNGNVPSQLSRLSKLNSIEIYGNSFNNVLDHSLQSLNIVSKCLLQNTPNEFVCNNSETLVPTNICSISCQGETLQGYWKTEQPLCSPLLVSGKIETSALEFKNNQSFQSIIRYLSDCNSMAFTLVRKGTFKIYNISQQQETSKEYIFSIQFLINKTFIIFHDSEVSRFLSWLCYSFDLPIHEPIDISSVPCNINVRGFSFSIPSVQQCPSVFNIGYVNFKNSTLLFGRPSPLSSEICSITEDLKPNNFSLGGVPMRKNWICDDPYFVDTCVPECGDGLVMLSETCDTVNGVFPHGCKEGQCQTRDSWTCEDSGTVDSTVCSIPCKSYDPKTYECYDSKSNNDNKLIIAVTVSCVCLLIFIVIVISFFVLRARKKRNENSFIISSSELQRLELLGQGKFGRVYRGIWRGTTVVAIKELKEYISGETLQLFQEEAKTLSKLPPHPNIVQFLGISYGRYTNNIDNNKIATSSSNNIIHTNNNNININSNEKINDNKNNDANNSGNNESEERRENSIFDFKKELKQTKIVTEFLVNGNLINFMRQRSNEQITVQKDYLLILHLAKGISAGMDHLHKNSLVHRDLASRNILIQGGSDSFINPKISDFGLSTKDQKLAVPLPVRWTSPEVLHDGRSFSKESDVWSFGILLFELSTQCSEIPYSQFSKNSLVRTFVMNGGQVRDVDEIPMQFKSLMRTCFSFLPSLRPSFGHLWKGIQDIEERYNNEQLNTNTSLNAQNSTSMTPSTHSTIEQTSNVHDEHRNQLNFYETEKSARSNDVGIYVKDGNDDEEEDDDYYYHNEKYELS